MTKKFKLEIGQKYNRYKKYKYIIDVISSA